ncbi:MAG: cytochrome c biogenesis protein CcdA [Candidatus Woesearchaeota archaeon]
MAETTFLIAFAAGIVSFFAPCILPLIPAFFGFLAGQKFERSSRMLLLWYTFLFVFGFSVAFSIIGVLLNSILSNVAYAAQTWLSRIAGTIIILFGFYLLGFIKPEFLQREHKFRVLKVGNRAVASFLFGAAFAVGWTPCVGAVLGSILALAAAMPGDAFFLLISYSLGLGIPFLIAGLFAKEFIGWVQRHITFLKYFNIIVGFLIVTLGILVFTNKLALIARSLGFLNRFLGG